MAANPNQVFWKEDGDGQIAGWYDLNGNYLGGDKSSPPGGTYAPPQPSGGVSTGASTGKSSAKSPWDPFNVNEGKFTTGAYPEIGKVTDTASGIVNSAQGTIDPLTGKIIDMTGKAPPTMTGPAPRGNTPTVSMPGRADAAAGEFYDPFGKSMTDARGKQADVYDAYGSIASGKGPSVAAGMVQSNAQTAATSIATGTQDANDRYGAVARAAQGAYDDVSTRAAYDYANASSDQRAAFEQAAKSASAATKQAAEDAIRSQASLVTRAGRGQLGSALLNAQSNAAFQTTDAQRRAAETERAALMAAGYMASDQQRTAAYNAAGTQRQIAAGQQTENATTASNAARGVIAAEGVRAQGDIAAGQVRSGEIMGALGAQAGIAGNIRAGDQGDAGLAISNTNSVLGIDTLSASVQTGNADRQARLDEAWAQMEQQAKTTNVGSAVTTQSQAYQALQGIMSTAAGREAMALSLQGNFASLAAQMGMSAQQLNAQVYGQAQALGVAWETASDQAKMQIIGSIISTVGTIGGVVVGAAIGGPVGAAAGGVAGSTVGGTVAGAATS